MTDKKIPYLMKGATAPTSASSILISSSRYLNDARVREGIALRMLGRNGRDLPPTYSLPALYEALGAVEDYAEVQRLFDAEKKVNPRFADWLSERYLSTMERDDFRHYPPESVGGIYYRYLHDRQFEPNIIELHEPESDLDYWQMRSSQIHDVFEHILAAAPFDIINEMVPTAMKITSVHSVLSPGLAGKLTIINSTLLSGQLMRATLHYPECMTAIIERMERGLLIGRTSEPYFMLKYEDILHLTPEAAREAIGMRNVLARDYPEQSNVISEGAYFEEMEEVRARARQREALEAV
ncbi:MAG: Coq4 family protein [Halieaceae bacterium]|uniref:Coq4 family protein n=1 Tax=Haliea alexandrii TaxID=2448162 RepID=UPI000F0BC064|nr:Coq4 family protein [Haliea alexandrii]MCR9184210.1 Coq4 family protein [Halieaceae bacterium]